MATAPLDFIHDVTFDALPVVTVAEAQRCLLDLIGVAAASLSTDLSRIIRNHAVDHFGPGGRKASIIFDGRVVSPAGAALAGGMAIDSIDAHDGHKPTKGHETEPLMHQIFTYESIYNCRYSLTLSFRITPVILINTPYICVSSAAYSSIPRPCTMVHSSALSSGKQSRPLPTALQLDRILQISIGSTFTNLN